MIESLATLILYGTILAIMVIAAFIVSPYMGLGMLIILFGTLFKRRNMV